MVTTVQAAEWTLSGTLNPSLQYDDNIFMRDANKLGDYQSTINLALKAAYEVENTTVSVSAGYVVERFERSRRLDKENPFVKLSAQYKTERSILGLGVSYEERSSRNDAVDTVGDFETESTTTIQSISPSYSYQVTELDLLSVSATYSETAYSTDNFNDSKSHSLSTSWNHQFTERLNAGLSVLANNNKSKGLATKSDDDTYNLMLTSNYDLSEVWGVDGSVGIRQLNAQQTDIFGVVNKSSSKGSTLSFNVSYKKEVDSASLNFLRTLSPSSTGDINEQDSLSLSWSRELTERFSANLRGSIQRTTSASERGGSKRINFDISPSINWVMKPDTDISLTYNYRQQKESLDDTKVSSNAVMLMFNYKWDGFSVSR